MLAQKFKNVFEVISKVSISESADEFYTEKCPKHHGSTNMSAACTFGHEGF